jgi:hypothetical protein
MPLGEIWPQQVAIKVYSELLLFKPTFVAP